MYANNEIGVIQPIREIARLARERGVLFHSDATQAVGKIPVNVEEDFIDLLSFSAHKLYGPKGIGALYVRGRNPRVRLSAQLDGGGHERGLRSGTLNVPGIAGFGEACAICGREMDGEARRLATLRDRLMHRLLAELEDVFVHGSRERRLPHNLNLSFAGVEASTLMMSVKEIAVSSGSACSSATPEPSHVLRAIGVPNDLARGAIRIGLGRFNTEEEIEYVAGRLIEAVGRLRRQSPIYQTMKESPRSESEAAGQS
jgi:cysteine desulfurase